MLKSYDKVKIVLKVLFYTNVWNSCALFSIQSVATFSEKYLIRAIQNIGIFMKENIYVRIIKRK